MKPELNSICINLYMGILYIVHGMRKIVYAVYKRERYSITHINSVPSVHKIM